MGADPACVEDSDRIAPESDLARVGLVDAFAFFGESKAVEFRDHGRHLGVADVNRRGREHNGLTGIGFVVARVRGVDSLRRVAGNHRRSGILNRDQLISAYVVFVIVSRRPRHRGVAQGEPLG